MNQHAYIYAIRHNITGKIYIGSSACPQERYKHHINRLRRGVHSVEDMQADFNRYGEDYTFTILEEVFNHRTGRERRWMYYYQTHDRKRGYNYKDPTAKSWRGKYTEHNGQPPPHRPV